MQKTLIIKFCDSCPYFNHEYDECRAKEKEVENGSRESGELYLHPIPEWCPLDEVNEISPKLHE